MKELRDQTKLAVHLTVLEGTHIVFVNNVQSMGTFTSNISLGTRLLPMLQLLVKCYYQIYQRQKYDNAIAILMTGIVTQNLPQPV